MRIVVANDDFTAFDGLRRASRASYLRSTSYYRASLAARALPTPTDTRFFEKATEQLMTKLNVMSSM